jgi:hypothetical protein
MKGVLFSVESIIAVGVLVLIFVFLFGRPLPSVETSKENFKLKTLDGLEAIKNTGELRKDALDNNASSIKTKLVPYVPAFLNYEVAIFNETSNTTPIPSIEAKDIITVSYFLAGDVGNYSAHEVKVYLWGFG